MSDSEFLRRVAPPSKRAELPEVLLWTLMKDGTPLEAKLRLFDHGPELRLFVNGELLESRVFRAGDPSLYDWALEMRRGFEVKGWTLQTSASDTDGDTH